METKPMDLPNVPLPEEGLFITHFLTVADQAASRAFYEGILGGTVVASDNPTFVKLANSWIILNRGGGPTPDKPEVILEPPQDPTRVNSFLNLRVADIQACYDEWKAKGAKFLTEPLDNHGWETRCYMQDPDGYIIEVGQAHKKMVDFLTGAKS
jgi:catechol 2,3-dioxygenase-like lactoylglutathione lyase family enzyme